jgi:hypothetical protein
VAFVTPSSYIWTWSTLHDAFKVRGITAAAVQGRLGGVGTTEGEPKGSGFEIVSCDIGAMSEGGKARLTTRFRLIGMKVEGAGERSRE